MRQKYNMLLAGVATLALLAGGGIAAAQQGPQGQDNAGAGMSAHGAVQTQSTKSTKQGAAAGMEQHAQTSSPNGSGPSSAAKTDRPSMAKQGTDTVKPVNKPQTRSAQTGQETGGRNPKQSARSSHEHLGENAKSAGEAKQRVGENAKSSNQAKQRLGESVQTKSGGKIRERLGATEKNGHERLGANSRSERDRSRMSERNERKGELKGLQGNTSIPMQGNHVNLTSEQRTRLRDSVIDARGAPRVGHVDFDVTVGTVVPRDRIHAVRVPETLVRIDPQWQGYLYFIVEDQVVIVNPRDMRIVAVLDV